MMKWLWIGCGAVGMGLATFSIAMGSVPMRGQVTDDTAMYQSLSEIKVPKAHRVDFDSDINQLSGMEGRYREKLPALSSDPRVRGPMERISHQKYRYVGRSAHQN